MPTKNTNELMQEWLEILKSARSTECLRNAPEELLMDKEFVLAAVQQNGYALQLCKKMAVLWSMLPLNCRTIPSSKNAWKKGYFNTQTN